MKLLNNLFANTKSYLNRVGLDKMFFKWLYMQEKSDIYQIGCHHFDASIFIISINRLMKMTSFKEIIEK